MKFQIRRLFWAFFLSGSCFLATFLWARSQVKVATNTGSEKLAQVTHSIEDSRKKLAGSLQWLPLETGDSLYDGDTIRTSDRSEVQINFETNNNFSIKVDSNSTFVIQKSKGEIALDLKEGSVFVDAKDTAGTNDVTNLVIVANEKKLELGGSKTQISKSKDQKTQLNILEGNVKTRDQSGNVKDISSGQAITLSKEAIKVKDEIKIISPNITKENDKTTLIYYVDPDTDSTVSFRWKGLPKGDEAILLVGDSKQTLKEREQIQPDKENANTLLSPGMYYWQLIARNPRSKLHTYESSVYKLQVQSRFSVLILAPKNDELLVYDNAPINVLLKWQKPAAFKSIFLEVTKSPTMSSDFIVNNRNVSNAQEFPITINGEGDYYWRIATKYEDIERPIYTKIQKIRVIKKEPPKPPPTLTWGTTQEKQYYLDKPTINISWDALSRKEEILKWKLDISDIQAKNVLSRELTDLKFSNNQMQPGQYKVTVEPFDKNGISMGKTTPKNIEILEMPLPKSPTIQSQNVKRNQNTNKYYFENGIVNLQWDYQSIVRSYEVEIYSPVNNKTEKILSSKNSLQYSGASTGLNPGAYQVKVTPIDQHNRRGPSSESFEFEVPSFTTMSAPKLKNLNIKQSGQ
ncbi:MAG: FecR domain-containing protein [Bdellovibrionaceae bacterium]|nr:FecR domain-containing protein [Pseudobdellovibrionaceae bacterium]